MPFTKESAAAAAAKRKENDALRAKGLLPPLPPKIKKSALARPVYAQPDPPGRVSLREHDVHGVSDVVESRIVEPVPEPFNFHTADFSACEQELIRLRDAAEVGGRILESRRSQQPRVMWHCAVCGTPVEDGRWKFKDDSRRDPLTGLCSPAVICSTTCYSKYWAERPRLGPRK
jgi:hypothetical protein